MKTSVIGHASALIVALLATACERTTESSASQAQLDDELTALREVAGRSTCEKDDQCHLIGMHPKICGGYYEFLIYGEGGINRDELETRVQLLNTLLAERDQKAGAVSDCMVIEPFDLHCVSYHCVAGPVWAEPDGS
jgi:hypothetical protein